MFTNHKGMESKLMFKANLADHIPAVQSYVKAVSLPSDLLMQQEGDFEIYYAPFEYINPNAKIVICGITPGFQQADLALITARHALEKGETPQAASRLAKSTASFAGIMRSNLVDMLNNIGVNQLLNVESCAAFFDAASESVHYTSALRYPVFYRSRNYSGAPSMLKHPALRYQLDHYLKEECQKLPDAIWIPLGSKAVEALSYMTHQGIINPEQILTGLPHPSGANAERISIFMGRKHPDAASAKTNSGLLLNARERLLQQVEKLSA